MESDWLEISRVCFLKFKHGTALCFVWQWNNLNQNLVPVKDLWVTRKKETRLKREMWNILHDFLQKQTTLFL